MRDQSSMTRACHLDPTSEGRVCSESTYHLRVCRRGWMFVRARIVCACAGVDGCSYLAPLPAVVRVPATRALAEERME